VCANAHFNKPAPSGLPSYDTSFLLSCQRIYADFSSYFLDYLQFFRSKMSAGMPVNNRWPLRSSQS
jgi:hypothetical protein